MVIDESTFFADLKEKKELVIDSINLTYGNHLFHDFLKLKKITIKDWGTCENAGYLFCGCRNLEEVILPTNWNNMIDINFLFCKCRNLKEVTLPDNWGKIKGNTFIFSDCKKLKYIYSNADFYFVAVPKGCTITNKTAETINSVFKDF